MQRRRLPSLTALRAFEAAARHGSFRLAAEELAVTDSAISHQIRSLEESLGVALFVRQGRAVALSEAGRTLYPILADAFDRMAYGADLVRRAGFAGELVLQVYVTVAARWLLPRLHRFQEAHPELVLRLATSHRGWDFDPGQADVGLVYHEPPFEADLHYRPLFRAPVFPVLAPSLLPPGGLAPADLLRLPLVRVSGVEDDWRCWFEAAGLAWHGPPAGPVFDTYLLAFEAAAAGRGVAIGPEFVLRGELATGRLVRPFALAALQPGGWYLVCRRERRHDPRIATLARWFAAEIAADPSFAPVSAAAAG